MTIESSGVRVLKHERCGLVIKNPIQNRGLDPSVVIGTDRRFPNQFIVGPYEAVRRYYQAFEILDCLRRPDKSHRAMSLIVSGHYEGGDFKQVAYTDGGQYINRDLLQDLKMSEEVDKSKYCSKIIDPVNASFGAIPDTNPPIALMPDYTKLYDQKLLQPATTLICLEATWHEWIHIVQVRSGLPGNTKIAERHAISEDCRMMELPVLNGLIKMDIKNEELVIRFLKWRQEIIEAYRKQEDHSAHRMVSKSYWAPDPVDYPLHDAKRDYVFR